MGSVPGWKWASAAPSTTHSGPFREQGGRSAREDGRGGKEREGRRGEGTASQLRGGAGLCALSVQRARYFIAGCRSQVSSYLGRAALKAF